MVKGIPKSKPGSDTVLSSLRPDGILVVTMDHFPINGLSRAVNNGLTQAVLDCEANSEIKVSPNCDVSGDPFPFSSPPSLTHQLC